MSKTGKNDNRQKKKTEKEPSDCSFPEHEFQTRIALSLNTPLQEYKTIKPQMDSFFLRNLPSIQHHREPQRIYQRRCSHATCLTRLSSRGS
jgi:hypothetical protein